MLVLCLSCGSNRPPSNVLPQEKMEIIIWQLAQSDEYVNSLLSKDSSKKSSTERMRRYSEIFDLNHVTEEEFKRSYRFYMTHPEVGKVMFDSISARASRQKDQRFAPKPDTAAHPTSRPDSGAHALKRPETIKPAVDSANKTPPKRDSVKNPLKQKLRNKRHPK